MRFLADRDLAAHVRVILILREKGVSADQYLAKPFKHGRVIGGTLDQFRGDRKDDLRINVPESNQRRCHVPRFDFLRLMQNQQGLHRFVGDV